ncbi:sterol desaturase family protein [soil metagenome]
MSTTGPFPLSRVRQALEQRRDRTHRVEQQARQQVQDDERSSGRQRLGLGGAWRQFWAHPSPWIITSVLVVAVIARMAIGDLRAGDLILPAIMIASFPLVEWLVHVFVLHLRPTKLGPLTIDPLLSRKHRAHHADPRDLPLVFIPWPVLVWLLPLQVLIAFLVFPPAGLSLTYLIALASIGWVYEWTHYLIHSDYPPRSRMYKHIWRNHRLHHYKNENYWFTVTTAGTADRLLRTYPDPADVDASPTAKNLLGA